MTDIDNQPRRNTTRNAMLLAGMAAVLFGVAVATHGGGPLTPLKAVVLGAVEGLTEYLPVSSTGHLLVTQRLLGIDSGDAADAYVVAIQLGAILAVVALYRRRLAQLWTGLVGRDAEGRRILVRLIIAFLPAAVVGFLASDLVKEHLFGLWPVIAAWAIGGVFLLWWNPRPGITGIGEITTRHAVIIGVVQILALWPGTSRSLVTIAAALAIGASMAAAVEFSFLLGLATLSAATVYDLGKHGSTIAQDYGLLNPLLGAFVAFLTAVVAVRWLVEFLRTRPLSVFGWYRIGAAVTAIALLAVGAL